MILVYWFAADRESDDSRMTEAASADPALVAEAERLLEDAVKLRRRNPRLSGDGASSAEHPADGA